MSESSSFSKWILGILGTVFAGFILWWLTGPQSPFQPKELAIPEEKKADVVITHFNLASPIFTSQTTTADFEVTNKGNRAATGCQLIWEVPGTNGSIPSEQFNLEPGQTKSFSLNSNTIKGEGTVTTVAHLSCSNSPEKKMEKPLVVNFMMAPGRINPIADTMKR